MRVCTPVRPSVLLTAVSGSLTLVNGARPSQFRAAYTLKF